MKKHGDYSVFRYVRVIMVILGVLGMLNIGLILFTISASQTEQTARLRQTTAAYMQQTSHTVRAVDHFMTYTIVNDDDLTLLTTIPKNEQSYDAIKPLEHIRSRVFDFQYSSGNAYQFFIYSPSNDFFANISPLEMSYDRYLAMQSHVRREKSDASWQQVTLLGKIYLLHRLTYEGAVLYCVIAPESLTAPLRQSTLRSGDGAYLSLNGLPLTKSPNTHKAATARQLNFNGEDYNLPFSLHITVRQFNLPEQLTVIQIVIVLLSTVIGILAFVGVVYLWRNFAIPLRSFSSALSVITEDNADEKIKNYRISEIDAVNEQIRSLLSQTKKLKLSLYEQEIAQKQSQIQLMRIQLRPHFYLNILSTIDSMIQISETKNAHALIMATTKYLRYLLRTNADLVPLAEELQLVTEYVQIQQIRYGHDVLALSVTVPPTLHLYCVPQLIVQVFVENAVKYGVTFDQQTQVGVAGNLVTHHAQNYLHLRVSNTGPWFPDTLLTQLNEGHPPLPSQGQHIGIANVFSRLRMLYGTDFTLHFTNLDTGGIAIDIEIPAHTGQTPKELANNASTARR